MYLKLCLIFAGFSLTPSSGGFDPIDEKEYKGSVYRLYPHKEAVYVFNKGQFQEYINLNPKGTPFDDGSAWESLQIKADGYLWAINGYKTGLDHRVTKKNKKN